MDGATKQISEYIRKKDLISQKFQGKQECLTWRYMTVLQMKKEIEICE